MYVVVENYFDDLEETQITLLTSIFLSNGFHLLSLIPLYYLTKRLFPLDPRIPVLSCILHSFSSAGIFLLSGNTESLFSFLSFTGMTLFHSDYLFLTAVIWGLAGLVRSNAILWTGFFVWEGLRMVPAVYEDHWKGIGTMIGKLIKLGLYCVITLSGFGWWQYSAWKQYCQDPMMMPEWCKKTIPLIYSHVQSKYW